MNINKIFFNVDSRIINVIKIVISSIILYLIFTKVDFSDIWSLFVKIDYKVVIALVLINFISLVIMVIKWKMLLTRKYKISTVRLFNVYLAADFFNMFLLGFLGSEAYKIATIKGKMNTFLTSLFDRLYSFAVYGLMILFYVFYDILEIGMFYSIIGVLILFVVWMGGSNYVCSSEKYNSFKYGYLEWYNFLLHNCYSFVYLSTVVLRFWLCFLVFGFNVDFYLLFVLAAIVIIATTLPISFQGLGVREFIFMSFAAMFAIDVTVAVSASFLFYVSNLIYRLFGIIPFLFYDK